MASRARRVATIAAAGALGMGEGRAADLVETQGLTAIAATLERAGWQYDYQGRQWRMPIETPAHSYVACVP